MPIMQKADTHADERRKKYLKINPMFGLARIASLAGPNNTLKFSSKKYTQRKIILL